MTSYHTKVNRKIYNNEILYLIQVKTIIKSVFLEKKNNLMARVIIIIKRFRIFICVCKKETQTFYINMQLEDFIKHNKH